MDSTVFTGDLPELGAPFGGGHYAGKIFLAGQAYALVDGGRKAECKDFWGNGSREGLCRRFADGQANSTDMREKCHSALALWVKELRLGGFADWYIPALDELDVIYRNLKPTTTANHCGWIDGYNVHAGGVPARRTAQVPAPTKVKSYLGRGVNAYRPGVYGTSTTRGHQAFAIRFDDGLSTYVEQAEAEKEKVRVRAIRRVPLGPIATRDPMLDVDDLPRVGARFGGGYFAGHLRVDGRTLGIVDGGKAAEFREPWGLPHGPTPGARSMLDGLANTEALAAAGSPLARKIRALDLGGHHDWHLPSFEVLAALYRSLKPTTEYNSSGDRDGYSAYGIMPGTGYRYRDPLQTSAERYRKGGPEAYRDGYADGSREDYVGSYCSSTEYSDNCAVGVSFEDGSYGPRNKLDFEWCAARAVRVVAM